MAFEVDRDNLLTYFGYLLKSFSKFEEKELSREKLAAELKEFRKLKISPAIKKHLSMLEKHMEDVIGKEKQIMKRQKKEKDVQEEIKTRIKMLEKRLSSFIEKQKEKTGIYQKIEEKIKGKSAVMPSLKKQVAKMEALYTDIKKSKKYSAEEIAGIEKRLNELKEKVKNIEFL